MDSDAAPALGTLSRGGPGPAAREFPVPEAQQRSSGAGRTPSPPPRGARWLGAAAGLVGAGLPILLTYGFTVDDALVSARVAHHVGVGLGHRFNPSGAVVDAVTPLGWAHLLAPLARGGVLPAWQAGRALGLLAWLAAATWLGVAVAARGERATRFVPLLGLAASVPVAAWAGAGMETGVVTALATVALARPRGALLAGGLAAGWRPELLPWAFTLAVGTAWADGDLEPSAPRPGRLAVAAALALAPAILVAALRTVWFGSPTPLSLLAKPSDLAHGAHYAAAAAIWTGAPLLVAAPWALLRAAPRTRAAALALGAHWLALVAAGGDWMPLFRLAVPVLPGAILIATELAATARPWSTWARSLGAVGLGAALLLAKGGDLRRVAARRLELVAAARPWLGDARRVAALDVGWVGAVGSFDVVDLAGITDPTIATLPGGHTTKRISHDLVDARDVDHVVLLLGPDATPGTPWARTTFARGVEATVAEDACERGFALVGTIPLGGTRQVYVVARRSSARGANVGY